MLALYTETEFDITKRIHRCSLAPDTALQDVAAASIVYEKALGAGVGVKLNLAE